MRTSENTERGVSMDCAVLLVRSSPDGRGRGTIAQAHRVFEGALEVGAGHEHPRRDEDQGEQYSVGAYHRDAYGQHAYPVVERRPLALLGSSGCAGSWRYQLLLSYPW
jgi:hypothetical protein